MRIHELEIHTSKQIRAFIQYLIVLSDEVEAHEKQQQQWMGTNVNAGSCLGSQIGGLGAAISATPEYLAKLRTESEAADGEKLTTEGE